MKIGVVGTSDESSAFYRLNGPLSEIESFEIIRIENFPAKKPFDWDVRSYDLILMQKAWKQHSLDLIEICNLCDVPVVVDYDDNLMEVPIHNPVYHESIEHKEVVREIIQRADVVTVSTSDLKEDWMQHNPKRIEVIPNAYNHRLFDYANNVNSNFGKIVLWRGSATHVRDIHTVDDEMTQVIDENPNWVFVFVNNYPHFLDERPNVSYLPWMHLTEYMHKTWMMKPAVVWAPLEDNLFNRCKSNCGWIEASHMQAITIGPDFNEWQVPGNFAYEAGVEGSFYKVASETLSKIDSQEGGVFQKGSSMNARSYIYQNLLLDHTNEMRSNLFEGLVH